MRLPQIPGGAARYRDLATIIGRRRLRAALDAGVLIQPWRGVVMRADAATDLRARAAAAVLATGGRAVLSGPTAIALHGHSAARSDAVHVTTPYERSLKSRPGLVVHQNRFSPRDVVRLDGLPVFAHDRALADYLCDGDKWDAFASLDQALASLGPVSARALKASIHAQLDARDDPRGIAKAITLLELATGKADSPPESWFRLIVVEAGLPLPEPQHEVRTIDGVLLYVLDMAWEQYRTALEYDGRIPHDGREDRDAERDRRLARRGWVVVRARATDLSDPRRVLSELRAAFARTIR